MNEGRVDMVEMMVQTSKFMNPRRQCSECYGSDFICDFEAPPYVLTQKEFWGCPTSVLTGASFFLLGIFVGIVIML